MSHNGDQETLRVKSLEAMCTCSELLLKVLILGSITAFSFLRASQESGSKVMKGVRVLKIIFYGQCHSAKCVLNILLGGKGIFYMKT